MSQDLLYQISLSLMPGIGGITAKKLVSYCGGVEGIFREKESSLIKIPGIGRTLAQVIRSQSNFARAEKEIAFIEKHSIQALFFLDKEYPSRLKHCEDGPVLLFVKGNVSLNAHKVVAVVGTRSITEYGREVCQQLVEGLSAHQALIVSGLAYGVDACAHKAALDHGLNTAAVLGHGLDRIYPPLHLKLARKVVQQGALVSDFVSGTKPDRENFPRRNRIIAGLCDAVIVVEAASRGGALITANIANSYNRDVFAVPGRSSDLFSAGCNQLIKNNKACLLETVADLEYIMGWNNDQGRKTIQRSLFEDLDPDEEAMVSFLRIHPEAALDFIVAHAGYSLSQVSALLLNLEFKGLVKPLPGRLFKLTSCY